MKIWFVLAPVNAMCDPSLLTAIGLVAMPCGVAVAKWIKGREEAGAGFSHTHRATPASTVIAAAATIHGRGFVLGTAGAAASSAGWKTSSSAAFKSRADCHRFSGSFSRQRFNTRSSAGGATSDTEGAGRSRIAALTLAADDQ